MTNKSEKNTAKSFLESLHDDPEWVQKMEERAEKQRRTQAELLAAQKPIIDDLHTVGVNVNRVWDLLNNETPPKVIPILIKHINKLYPPRILEAIARALATPSASTHWATLLEKFERTTEKEVKDGLAVALAKIASYDERFLGEVIDLLKDEKHGTSRVLLLEALENSKYPRAREILLELRNFPSLQQEVERSLKRLR
ncbi:hypothetical protein G6O69_18245 [Pseudenhygromyxa sp. WMMC2535]|uniref:hypothetical protein n=1 Tax=Pseudenhygromyxa sp. WMMC2535 TaxID=2712867 RepID=UPI001554B488|nr:hypothetical protein [Pseudenhygromyxa sp. WMMC2535]NVB39791.1 hypothetical protein [Pseudenhygromyxa sp. WMMC2535]